MRWVVLAAGIILGVLAVWHGDGLTGLLAVFLLLQGVTGNGCLVSRTCAPPANKQPNKPDSEEFKEVGYTEIKA